MKENGDRRIERKKRETDKKKKKVCREIDK